MSTPQHFRLIDDETMLNEPDLEYVIDGVSPCKSLALVYGQSGHGKSFVGLDVAFCVASVRDWCGHAVKNGGLVLYMAAEGQAGIKDRVRAWKEHHGITGAVGVWFLPEPVNLQDDDEVAALELQLDALVREHNRPLRLLIIDTWAACLAAGEADENSARDVGRVLFQLRRLAERYGLTVWIIHHEGHAKRKNAPGRARGSSSLKAAVETEIGISQTDDVIKIVNTKQRYTATFEPLRLRRQVVELGEGRTSCVLIAPDAADNGPPSFAGRAREALSALWQLEHIHVMWKGESRDAEGVSYSEWHENTVELPATSFG